MRLRQRIWRCDLERRRSKRFAAGSVAAGMVAVAQALKAPSTLDPDPGYVRSITDREAQKDAQVAISFTRFGNSVPR